MRVSLKSLSILLASILVVATSACKSSSTPATESANEDGVSQAGMAFCGLGVDCSTPTTDTGNYSICRRPTSAGVKLSSHIWMRQLRDRNGALYLTTFQFSSDESQLSVESNCELENFSLQVAAKANLHVRSVHQLQLLNNQSVSQQLSLADGKTLICSSHILAGFYEYSFKGDCLVLSNKASNNSSQTLVLMPLRQ